MYGMTIPLNPAMFVKYANKMDGLPIVTGITEMNIISCMYHIKSYFTANLYGKKCYNDLMWLQFQVGCTFGHSHYLSWVCLVLMATNNSDVM